MLAEERGALDNAETQEALGLRALRQRVEQGDSLLTLPGPAPSLRARVDVEEQVEHLAAGFGEGPARSPEGEETRALRREIVRLRAPVGCFEHRRTTARSPAGAASLGRRRSFWPRLRPSALV